MARRRITDSISVDFKPPKHPEWRRIRTSDEIVDHLQQIGIETVTRCNADLHAAQARRNQPQEDGYDATITTGGSRARLYIDAFTARAKAHEAVNNAILKNLPIGDKPAAPPPDRSIPQELGRRNGRASST